MTHKYMAMVAVLGLACITPLTAVHAGFQFTAPVGQVQNQQAIPPLSGALLPTVPDIAIEGGVVMPAVPTPDVQSQPTQLLPTPTPAPAPMDAAPSAPKTGLLSLMPKRMAQPQQMPAQPQGYAMAVGFGKDLPLVTALRQVVPPEYTYVLDDSIPMSSTVSWNGGRPWDIVLSDMIAPLGLSANVSGNRVSINSRAVPSPAPQMAAMSAPTPVVPAVAPTPIPAVAMATAAPVMVQPAPQMRAQPVSMAVPKATRGSWIASKGDSLRSVLEEWSNQAGSDLFWSSDYDYPLAGAVNLSGSFEEAVQNLLRGFEQARPKPIARLHPNLPHGPAVLVVETRQTLD